MNESCHTYEWLMRTSQAHIWMTHAWVMSLIWMSHATRMNESCHTYESLLWMSQSQIWMTHMNESCHTYESVPVITHMNVSSHTYEWVMSYSVNASVNTSVTWLILACDMACEWVRGCERDMITRVSSWIWVWHDSFSNVMYKYECKCGGECDMTTRESSWIWVWHDSFSNVMYEYECKCGGECDMTHSCVWHDHEWILGCECDMTICVSSWMCVSSWTWVRHDLSLRVIYVNDYLVLHVTHSCVLHDYAWIRGCECDMTTRESSWICVWHDSFSHVMYKCEWKCRYESHFRVWHDHEWVLGYVSVTWLYERVPGFACDMTHSHMWYINMDEHLEVSVTCLIFACGITIIEFLDMNVIWLRGWVRGFAYDMTHSRVWYIHMNEDVDVSVTWLCERVRGFVFYLTHGRVWHTCMISFM